MAFNVPKYLSHKLPNILNDSDPCMEIELSSTGITNEFLKVNGTGILLGRFIRERLSLNGKPSYRHESNPVFLYWSSQYLFWGVIYL